MASSQVLSRRRFLEVAAALGTTLSSAELLKLFAQQQALVETPNMTLGPFYPLLKPLDRDADLTRLRGRSGNAAGQVIDVTGRVLNSKGEPVRNARVEIWQANSYGRYAHESDPNKSAALDPNFQGFGVQATDTDGRYRFKTIMPAPYPTVEGWMRAPHIHFDVQGRFDRKGTQMFFPGETLNNDDRLLQAVRRNREQLIARVTDVSAGAGAKELLVTWDIVLISG